MGFSEEIHSLLQVTRKSPYKFPPASRLPGFEASPSYIWHVMLTRGTLYAFTVETALFCLQTYGAAEEWESAALSQLSPDSRI